MTSVALDACLCLLLVSAAAVTVTSVPTPSAEPDRADAVAETLTATTAEVTYSLRPVPGTREANGTVGPEYDRTAHGTLASLLARAAVRTVRVDGEPLTETNAGFANAVSEVVRNRLPARTQVVVRFQPYPDSHLGRVMRIGPTPPPTADVHAATVHAPSRISPPANPEVTAAREGFDGLARLVATELVAGLFPPEKGRLALAGDAPVTRLVRHRYARADDYYGVETAEPVERGDTEQANSRLSRGVARRVTGEFRTRFESPEKAAASLRLGSVKISIRTWSA
ncbi:MAG: hypothetical protein ABEH90_03190 [Halolamina sp.]